MDPIETTEDWNEAMGWVWNPYYESWYQEGCCCPMPMCPVPTFHCDYRQAVVGCGSSADVETYGPDGYNYYQGCFLPFAETHDPLDATLVGKIYRFHRPSYVEYEASYTGTGGYKFAGNYWMYCPLNEPVLNHVYASFSYTDTFTVSVDWVGPGPCDANIVWTPVTQTWLEYDFPCLGEASCTPMTPLGMNKPGNNPDFCGGLGGMCEWEIVAPATWECEEAMRRHVGATRQTSCGTAQSPDACPGPWGQGAYAQAFLRWDWWDISGQDNTYREDLFDPIDRAGLIAEAEAAFPAWSVVGDCEDPYSWTRILWPSNPVPYPDCDSDPFPLPSPGGVISVFKLQYRFKWKIPDTFRGRWFKVTYDLVFYPEGSADAEVIAEDEVDEWTGPGDPEDPETWMFPSDYVVLSNPLDVHGVERNGQVHVRNIRFQCYRGPFGEKPQVTGTPHPPP